MKKTVYARDYGFLPSASAHENREALQRALDCGGEITVDVAGIYDVGGTVLIGSNTRLAFAEGTAVRRAALGEGQHDEGFITVHIPANMMKIFAGICTVVHDETRCIYPQI